MPDAILQCTILYMHSRTVSNVAFHSKIMKVKIKKDQLRPVDNRGIRGYAILRNEQKQVCWAG